MSLFNTNVMHISLFVTFLMIVYLYIAGAYFICLHNPQLTKYIIKQNPRLIHHFLKKKSVALFLFGTLSLSINIINEFSVLLVINYQHENYTNIY